MRRTTQQVREECQQILQRRPVFLDTETTGLAADDRIVDIAIVDADGAVLLNQLVNPGIAIAPQAEAIHGISSAMVADAPTIDAIAPMISKLLAGRPVVIYNVNFDVQFLHRSGIWPEETYCLMQAAQDFFRAARWPRLDVACYKLGVERKTAHRALVDADDARRVFLAIARG